MTSLTTTPKVTMVLDVRHLEAYARNSLVGLVNASVKSKEVIEFVCASCHTVHEGVPVYEILDSYDNFDGEDFQHDAQLLCSLIGRLKQMYYQLLRTEGNIKDPYGRAYNTYPFSSCELRGVSLYVYFHTSLANIMTR